MSGDNRKGTKRRLDDGTFPIYSKQSGYEWLEEEVNDFVYNREDYEDHFLYVPSSSSDTDSVMDQIVTFCHKNHRSALDSELCRAVVDQCILPQRYALIGLTTRACYVIYSDNGKVSPGEEEKDESWPVCTYWIKGDESMGDGIVGLPYVETIEQKPICWYIVMDGSGSMNETIPLKDGSTMTRWDVSVQLLDHLVQDL